MEEYEKYDRDKDGIPDKNDINYNPSFIEYMKDDDLKRRDEEHREQLKAAGSKPRRSHVIRH